MVARSSHSGSFFFFLLLFFFKWMHAMASDHAGYIDLSKRRVDTEEIAKCESRWNKSKQVQSIMTRVAKSGMSDDLSAGCWSVPNACPLYFSLLLARPHPHFLLSLGSPYPRFTLPFSLNRAFALTLSRLDLAQSFAHSQSPADRHPSRGDVAHV